MAGMVDASFGIYFGTSNFSIAMNKDGKTDVLANYAGDRVTPSLVSFIDGEKCVGTSAKQMRLRYASSTISHIKNLIGKESLDIKDYYGRTCKLITQDGNKFEIDDGNKVKHYSPEEILKFFFQHMLEIAQRCSQESTAFPAVVTVPWHFLPEQRKIIKECASKAGFEVLRVINEPAAAALSYKIGQESNHSNCNIVIFRVGGTSMDVTIMKVLGGIYRIIYQIHKEHLGGDNMTKCLVDFCSQEFQRQYKVSISDNKRAMGKLWNAAESCKQGLTTVNTAICCAESLHEGIDLSLNVSRARFESLINSTLQQCLEQIDCALQEAGLDKDDIDKVVLAGGSTKISRLQDMIKDKFMKADVFTSIPPDEVVALGAAEEAALIYGKETNEVCEIDVLSNSVYLKLQGEEGPVFVPVFKKGTLIPSKWHHTFNIPSGQSNLSLNVYEGVTYNNVEKAMPLAKVSMNEVENAEILVSFQIRTDASLHVTCTNKVSNKTESVIIECEKSR